MRNVFNGPETPFELGAAYISTTRQLIWTKFPSWDLLISFALEAVVE